MLIVYPDTNILLEPLDVSELNDLIHEPFKVVILSTVIDELHKIIREQKGRHKLAAKLAIQMVKSFPIEESSGFVDDILVEKASQGSMIVTIDKELKRRIKEKNGKIITKRQNYLFVP